MKPLGFVIFQLSVLGFAYVAHVRHDPSPMYRFLCLASVCGVIGLDAWYFRDFAYPAGFEF
jgi:hypothetical protein